MTCMDTARVFLKAIKLKQKEMQCSTTNHSTDVAVMQVISEKTIFELYWKST